MVTSAGLPEGSLLQLFQAISNGTATALEAVPGFTNIVGEALVIAQQDAFSGALKEPFLVTIAFGSCGITAAFFSKNIDHLMASKVSRKLYKRKEMTAAWASENKLGLVLRMRMLALPKAVASPQRRIKNMN